MGFELTHIGSGADASCEVIQYEKKGQEEIATINGVAKVTFGPPVSIGEAVDGEIEVDGFPVVTIRAVSAEEYQRALAEGIDMVRYVINEMIIEFAEEITNSNVNALSVNVDIKNAILASREEIIVTVLKSESAHTVVEKYVDVRQSLLQEMGILPKPTESGLIVDYRPEGPTERFFIGNAGWVCPEPISTNPSLVDAGEVQVKIGADEVPVVGLNTSPKTFTRVAAVEGVTMVKHAIGTINVGEPDFVSLNEKLIRQVTSGEPALQIIKSYIGVRDLLQKKVKEEMVIILNKQQQKMALSKESNPLSL